MWLIRGAKTSITVKVMLLLSIQWSPLTFAMLNMARQIHLQSFFMHRSTKMIHAVPTPAKRGRSLSFLTQELGRFVTWLEHQEVCLRTDNEPSTVSLLDSCRKALKGLRIHMSVELVVPGNKEGNGAGDCFRSYETKPTLD